MIARIADISHYQEKVDWAKARNALDYLILRASIGLKRDNLYLQHVEGWGKPFGVYHYVKAGTAEDARTEARWFVQCANAAAARPNLYFADIEFSAQTKTTTEAVCVAFLEELRALDCPRVGLYIGQSRYKYAGKAIGMCDVIWIPRYGDNDGAVPPEKYYPKYPCDLWQYTSHGHVDGITGRVDLNLLWGDKALEWFTDTDNTAQKEGCDVSTKLMTAAEIVARAIDIAKNVPTIYMYGCYGFQVTDATIRAKSGQGGSVGSWYTSTRIATLKKVANRTPPTWGFDCVNLYKGILWGWTGDQTKEKGGAKYAANGVPDTNANGMFDRCTGKSADFSKIEPGEALWISGHFGLYIGGGLAVECTPKWKNGVQITAVGNIGKKSGYDTRTWTKHGKLPYIDYTNAAAPAAPMKLGDRELRSGDTGDDVAELQNALVKLGYDLGSYGVNKDGVDGDFGAKTQAAVKKVQAAAGLQETGTYDTATHAALLLLLAPPIITPEIPEAEDQGAPEAPPAASESVSTNDDQPGEDEAPTYVLILQGDAETLRKLMLAYGGTLAEIQNVEVKEL